MKKKLLLFLLLVLGALPMFAQSIKISGRISSSNGAVAGATVVVKDSSNGTITDSNGNYSIEASSDATLMVTAIGYKTKEAPIGNRTTVNVEMQDDLKAIDQVVVTAIGIKQQKKKLGYTTQQVNVEALEQPGTVNVGNALSGQIAGLTVNNPTGIFQAPSFELRGQKPLMVVDGIPVSSDLFDISPENIASINVLKGTAASALYGSRGKDGAILISTKLASQDGVVVNVGLSNMVTAGYTVFPKTQNEFGSGSNGKYEFWDGRDGGISDGDMTWGPRFEGQLIPQWNSPILDKQTGEQIPWWGDVEGSIYNDRARYSRVPIKWEAHDNLKEFMRVGVITKATFSVASRSSRANINFNGDFARQQGQVPNTSIYTGGLNFNSVFNLSKTVTFSANLSYNKVYSPNYPRYGYGPKNHMYTIMLWMGNDVDGRELEKHLYRPDAEGLIQANYNYAWYNNPYFAAKELKQIHDRNTVNGQVKLNWDIFPGLSIQGRAAGRLEGRFEDMKSPKSYMNYGDSRNGDYKTWNTNNLDINADALASYNHAFGRNFAFTVNLGTSLYYRQIRKGSAATDGLIVPGVYNMGNSLNPVSATSDMNKKAIESIYGSLNVDLWNALFLTFTGRNDRSSTLASDHNSYFYPSVSASTLVNEYIKLPKWMDYLKVNTAWAQVSSDLDPYSLTASYDKGNSYGNIPSMTYPSNLPNPDILPQTTNSFEVGASTSFLNNRVGFEATYYRMVDKNHIIKLPNSEASGFTTRLTNGNEYTTNGYELIVTATPILKKNFSWNVAANWSGNFRKLTKIYGGAAKFGDLKVGDRADAIYATEWQKNPDGALILGSDGMPTHSPYKSFVGNRAPDARFGLQNTFKIKKFTVNVDVDGAIGGTLISKTTQKMWWGGKHPESTIYRQEEYDNGGKPIYVPNGVNVVSGEVKYDTDGNIVSDNRVYKPNETAVNIQTWAQNYPYRAVVRESEDKLFANTFDRSYLKLRRVAVSYDFSGLIDSRVVKGLTLTLFANNVAVIKKTPYIDPDFGASDDDLQDPSARYIGLNASVKF